MPIESVVADANVLLSAAIGKAALRVFTEYEVTVHAAAFNAGEVAEYLRSSWKVAPGLRAGRLGTALPRELVELQWKLLPMQIHDTHEYLSLLAQATADLAGRDPEDAHALALARHLGLPLWSNDRDFEGLGLDCYPTSKLLAILRRQRE